MDPATRQEQRTFLGHPLGLYVLFFTEMWERFSYYGMRALLVLYMVNYFKWEQADASGIYKWYTSLVYLTPLAGGYLADRYLGNKWAVIIGAILMAAGEFMLAINSETIFYSALGFLIVGNGFFKPNMSTQVGRLYPPNDLRRDGAYTIFYMGINLGAFLSPLVCGWLAENTIGQQRTGFMAAGIGMILGLGCYLFGLPLVVEIDQSKEPEVPPSDALSAVAEEAGAEPVPQATRPADIPPDQRPSVAPLVNMAAPGLFLLAGAVLTLVSVPLLLIRLALWLQITYGALLFLPLHPEWAFPDFLATDSLVGLTIVAICALISAWIIKQVNDAERDRVLSIFILGAFVVFFWAAFEQAGNALNLWADKSTDRFLTQPAPVPDLYPKVVAETAGAGGDWLTMWQLIPPKEEDRKESASVGAWWNKLWNPVPTTWFQSINALAIVVLAPFFAALWVWLAKRGANPSTPAKMAVGVLLVSASFGIMVASARQENQPSSVKLQAPLPESGFVNEAGQLSKVTRRDERKQPLASVPFQAGRLTFDKSTQTLNMTGVLSDLERDRIVRETAPESFVKALEQLKQRTDDAKGEQFEEKVVLEEVPEGLDLRYDGIDPKRLHFDAETKTLIATNYRIQDKDLLGLKVAGADKDYRAAIDKLYIASSKFKVSSWWLFWCYILATLGELCLSPVGLSMVSKLAPARFATMLMGLWLLTSFFGNFAAGAFGETWGTVDPATYFLIPVVALAAAAVVLLVLVRKIVSMMHGVN